MHEVVVVVPPAFRRFAGRSAEVVGRGTSVRGVLASLRQDHPELARRLLDDEGAPRRFLVLLLNGSAVTATPDVGVAPGDRLTLLVAAAGG